MAEGLKQGMFITFEGIDGAGKSSHIERTAEMLRAAGREVVRTREPGGTELAELLRGQVLTRSMDSLTETLLIFAARRDHLVQLIMPALERGAVVLCDRFTDSTFAYQGYGRHFDLGVLNRLEQWVQEGTEPDLTLWFDLPPAEAAARLVPARKPDRFESEPCMFFEAVAQGYRIRMQENPHRFVRIDATESMSVVGLQVQAALRSKGVLV